VDQAISCPDSEKAPEVAEDWKWSVPVWTCKGNVVASGVFIDHVKLNFLKSASLPDLKKIFNARLKLVIY
jgi:hypothetical protein